MTVVYEDGALSLACCTHDYVAMFMFMNAEGCSSVEFTALNSIKDDEGSLGNRRKKKRTKETDLIMRTSSER